MLYAKLKSHMTEPHALIHEVPTYIYIYIYILIIIILFALQVHGYIWVKQKYIGTCDYNTMRLSDVSPLQENVQKLLRVTVTPQSNCTINFMGLYACHYLNYF